MDISMFLAQAFGLYLVIVSIAFLAQPKVMDDVIDLFSANRAAVITGGLFILLVGIPLVLVHSIWSGPLWQSAVSLLAWATFLKGAVRVLMPGMVINWSKSFKRNPNVWKSVVGLMLVLGLYLCYVGFGIGA